MNSNTFRSLLRRVDEGTTKEETLTQFVTWASDQLRIDVVAYRRNGDDVFQPVADSSASGGATSISVADSPVVKRAIESGSPTPLEESDTLHSAVGSGRSGAVAVPLGTHAMIVAASEEGEPCESTTEFLELASTYAKRRLDTIQYRKDVRTLERLRREQTSRYERMARITEKVRKMDQALIQANSRNEIERVVCERLLTSDRFSFVWIGEPDRDDESLRCRRRGGDGQGFLDEVSLRVTDGDDDPVPSCRTAKTGEATVVPNISDDGGGPWRDPALDRGFYSAASVPLVYEEIVYAIVTIYADEPFAFGDLALSVLIEMGETIGYAINAAEVKRTLTSESSPDIRFQIVAPDDPFVALATRTGCELEVNTVSARSADDYVAYVSIHEADPDRVRQTGQSIDSITRVSFIGGTDGRVYEIGTTAPCIPVALADIGARPRSITVSDDRGYVTASVPSGRDVRSFVEQVQTIYPTAEPVARFQAEAAPSMGLHALDQSLTDRQREVLEAAYFSGFFEWPRHVTGEEVASSLGISQPAFLQHLRAAEKKLARGLCEFDRIETA